MSEFSMIELIAKIGRCWSPSFSPDGQQIAFISDLSGIPQVWCVSTQGGWPMRVTSLDDQVTAVYWSPDGEWLAFQVAPGGGMNTQVYIVRPDGTGQKLLTPGGITNNWLGMWTDDSSRVVVSSSARTPQAMDGYFIDLASGDMELAVQNDGIGSVSDTNAGRVLVSRVMYRGDSNIYLVDAQGEKLLTPHTPPAQFYNAKFADNGAYLISNDGRDMRALAYVDFSSAQLNVIRARDDAELDEFALSHDKQLATLVWNKAGRSELELYHPATGESRSITDLPGEIVGGLTFARDDTQFAFVISGAVLPTDIWTLAVESGEIRQVTHSPHPGVVLSDLVPATFHSYTAHDGLELTGWLYQPHEFSSPGPVVLSFHGGPEGQERPSFRAVYQALAAQGITIFAPNVRGSSGFGKQFVNLDNGALRFDAIRDIESTANYLINEGIAAPGHIGIMGGSYGGYMTMAGLVEYPDLFAAGANLYGVVNFKTFFENTEPWMAAISKVEYGDPDTEGALLDRLSPIHRLGRVKAATLVLHGANDTNVPVIEAEQVVAALQQQGTPVEYVLFPDEGHGFLKERNRIQANKALVDWFTKYLQ